MHNQETPSPRTKGLNSAKKRILATMVAIGLVIVILLSTACNPTAPPPILTSLNPVSGPPGTVVEVQGDNLLLSRVVWDANTPTEQFLPTSVFSGSLFFTVPLTASIGAHPIAYSKLLAPVNQSNTVDFTVTTGTVRPQPRIDDITVSNFSIDTNNRASMFLMAHGANIDVGAQILVNGVEQSTIFYRLLRNPNVNTLNPATLGYPIFHYATIWTTLRDQAPNSMITVSIKNLDGSVSNDLTYQIAMNMDELDSDGDGLPDNWERNGYDADDDGTIDVNLPALGANPLRKDLFVECDWMNDASPNANIWTAIENTFANAPILNSDGSQGISIHIDRGQAGAGGGGGTIIPFASRIRYDNLTPDRSFTYTNFYTVKANNFNANRLDVYQYCVFAWDNGITPGSSGQAEDIWSNDFFVSLGNWGANGQRADFQTGTFIHELGHTLNLRHGGFEDTNSKDNYNSIMQYGNSWITWNGQSNTFSPSQMGGIDVDCNLLNVDGVFTYSEGMWRDLDENNLNENIGICSNVARDWNGNGTFQSSVAVNLDSNSALTTIADYADWAHIEVNFRARGSNWGSN